MGHVEALREEIRGIEKATICQKVLKIEKNKHFLASQPFVIRNRIAEMAICDGK